MARLLGASLLGLACVVAYGQQGGSQGPVMGDGTTQGIERSIAGYLNGNEIKSILTPGDPLEWDLELKAGQVVVAEARSDSFDPAMEIAKDGKVLFKNDDRYPGDQRPLLFWRCEVEGKYKLRVRSYLDKVGGQTFVRFKTYHSVDLSSGEIVERELDSKERFFLRVPMKAGQIKDVISEIGGPNNFMAFHFNQVIAPNGLPDISLSAPLNGTVNGFMAPVAGDYYLMYTPNTGLEVRTGRIRVGTREVVPGKLEKVGNSYTVKAPTNVPALWEISVKKGEFLEASATDLSLSCRFVLAEVPDVSKFDMEKPETNPFYPRPRQTEEPPFDVLPGRARDGRITVFHVTRDAKLWLATDGRGPEKKQFAVQVKPAAESYAEDKANTGKLKVGSTDYWAFNAKAGDVMTLNSIATEFSQQVVVRDPDMSEIRQATADPDQNTESWRMIIQKPGRYLVAVSCLGDGGGGDYSLTRKVYEAKEFGRSVSAKSEITPGQVQIWKFTAAPNDPMLVRWISSNWDYGVSIYDEKGNPVHFQLQDIDKSNRLGILKVNQPQTYVFVLTGGAQRSNYEIKLGDLPGFEKVAVKSSKGG